MIKITTGGQVPRKTDRPERNGNMEQLVFDICALVRDCGGILLKADREGMRIDSKAGSANFVTEYDTRVQGALREGLGRLLPEARFVGEEGEGTDSSGGGLCFVVDPIDGTTNFIKDYHMSCISVGLLREGVPELGVIYNPYLDEMYWARRGRGAWCNGKPIHVSAQPLERGIVLFGTSPYSRELARESFRMAYDYFLRAMDVRRSGSAALDLCAIAAGRAELYFELILQPWDYAAGALLVEEAGGRVTCIDGTALRFDRPCSLLATNR